MKRAISGAKLPCGTERPARRGGWRGPREIGATRSSAAPCRGSVCSVARALKSGVIRPKPRGGLTCQGASCAELLQRRARRSPQPDRPSSQRADRCVDVALCVGACCRWAMDDGAGQRRADGGAGDQRQGLAAGPCAPVPFWVLSVLMLVGVCTSVLQQGVVGVLWSYPALFIFFYVLPAAWPCRWVWRSCWAPACAAL